MTTLRRIVSVEPRGNRSLILTWDDGAITPVNFSDLISVGGVFEPLDDPDTFVQVILDLSGRFITFPCEVDFCADALRLSSGSLDAGTT
ncbi:MAG TPA: DUF2442 domain-containing protein [Thermomicrobiales bacterium]|nr:DUF2442 domain-containing protein [Thermomicrobiales bacterium]